MTVRGVEEPCWRVGEVAGEKRQPDGPVRDVGDRSDHRAVLPQERKQPLERGQGIAQVFEDVAQKDDVEAARREFVFEVERLDVPHDHALGVLLGDLRHLGVELDPGDAVAACGEDLCDVAGGGTDLQDPATDPGKQHHLGQALIGVVEVDLELVVRPA